MSKEPRKLRILDAGSGEVLDGCPNCADFDNQLTGLTRDIRGWRHRYGELKRDKAKEACEHPLWEEAGKAFRHWQKVCRHERSGFQSDRFWLVEPYLKERKKYGLEMVMRAIDGAAFDPYITTRKNGTKKKHDDWELIFKHSGKVEEFANRAPIKREK